MISTGREADDAAENAAWNRAEVVARAPILSFKRDPRFVRIPVIEEELKKYLNDEGSGDETARVVLLYGRAGSGKSSMAQNLALDYEQAARSVADDCASDGASGCRKFDDVLYVECGPEAYSKDKFVELFDMLSWEKCSNSEEEKYRESQKVEPMLKRLLQKRCSLVILDDVWEGTFLKDMVGVCGKHTRVLVTLQTTHPCADSLTEPTKSVPMDRLTSEDFLKLLKAHTGFLDEDDIPEPVKICMCDLATKVHGHPHAMASVAVAIDARHRNRARQWEDAIREYEQLLDDFLVRRTMNYLRDVQYERSFIEIAIQMKFRRLREEEKKLMILMVMLRSPWVPEEILQLFHREIIVQDNSQDVKSCRDLSHVRRQLEDFQCIKINHYKRPMTESSDFLPEQHVRWWRMNTRGVFWSIHRLDEQFIQRKMNNDINAMLEAVKDLPNTTQALEVEPQVNVAKLLGYLFFKAPFSKRIGASLKNPNGGPLVANVLSSLYCLPLIALMTKNIGESWSITLKKSCDQMFLSCVADGVLHNDAAKELLKSAVSKQQAWTLISHWRWTRGRRWFLHEDVIIGVLRVFGDLDLSTNNSIVASLNPAQWNVLLVLVSRESLTPSRPYVFKIRRLVLGLIELVTSPNSPRNAKHLGAVVFTYLVPFMHPHGRFSQYGQEGLASIPVIIEELGHSLQEYSDREVHESAARALSVLASRSNSETKQKMISVGFHRLVDNLEKEEDVELQGLALGMIEDLVFGKSVRGLTYKGLDFTRIQVSTSMIQALSDCLATIIARDRAEKNAWGYKGDAVDLLMKIDPVRAKGMILHLYQELRARRSESVEQGNTRIV